MSHPGYTGHVFCRTEGSAVGITSPVCYNSFKRHAGLSSLSNATLDSALFQTPRWAQLFFRLHAVLNVPPECQLSWNKLFFYPRLTLETILLPLKALQWTEEPSLVVKVPVGF